MTSLANRAVAERKKFEADAMQYQSEVVDVRQEVKIVDERVKKQNTTKSNRRKIKMKLLQI